jgi:hypothetical protein
MALLRSMPTPSSGTWRKSSTKDAPQFDQRQAAQVRLHLPSIASSRKTGEIALEIKTKAFDDAMLIWGRPRHQSARAVAEDQVLRPGPALVPGPDDDLGLSCVEFLPSLFLSPWRGRGT